MAHKVYRAWSKSRDARGRDESGLVAQTQTPGHMATRSKHKALVHLLGKLMVGTNMMQPPRLRGHDLQEQV